MAATTETNGQRTLNEYFGGQAGTPIDENPQPATQTAREKAEHESLEFLQLRREEESYLNERPWLLESAQEVAQNLRATFGEGNKELKVAVTQSKPREEERPVGIVFNWGVPNTKGSTWIANGIFLPVARDEQGVSGIKVGNRIIPFYWKGQIEGERESFKDAISEEIVRVAQERQQIRKVTPFGK